jgi:hypothetical protein
MKEVTFTYQRNKEDVLKQQVWQTFLRNKIIFVFNILFPLIGILFLVSSILTQNTDPIIYLGIAYLTFYPLISYGFIKLRVNASFKDDNVVFDTTTFTYSDAGIKVTSDQGEIDVEWSRIYRIYETSGYFYLYADKRTSVMVNKEHIGSEKTQAIKALMKKNAGYKAIKFK